MITITQSDNEYQIRFSYDPTLVQLIKQVPQRRWVPEQKYWSIPLDKLGFLFNQLKGTMYESKINLISQEHINENQNLDEIQTQTPNVNLSHVNFYVQSGSKPYKHQLDFMKWSIYREAHGNMNGFLLLDEQGLGKSIETLNLAIYNQQRYHFKRCLIICCVNPAKYHWYEDIYKHTNGQYVPYILGTRKKKNGMLRSDTGSKEKLEDLQILHMYGDENAPELPYFIIMNIEGIRMKQGKYYPICNAIIDACNKHQIDMIAIDEVHKNTSPSSCQGKRLLEISKKCPNVMFLPLTGTPITSKPTDLFLPLKLVKGHKYTSYYTWSQKFCIYGGYGDHEIIGYRNMDYLKSMLEPNMIRRLKKNVLDLPPKIYYTEYVENTDFQKKLYQKVADAIYSDKESIVSSLNPLSQFLRLRQVNGSPEAIDETLNIDKDYTKYNAKFYRLTQLLEEIHQRGEKVVVFSSWVHPLRTLYTLLKDKYNICIYTGTMKDSDREKHKQVFLHNPNYTIMMGTIGALGTMHTLTVANNVIFYDEPWTATDKAQAEDRVHRISATTPVNIYTILTKDTVDERVHNIIYTKEGISNFIVDNIDIRSNPELFDLLLSDTIKSK